MMTDSIRISKNNFGFFEVMDKPSKEELQDYYSRKYYQSGAASYELQYSQKELEYFQNKIEEKVYVAQKYTPLNSSSHVLDIGCGEGWVLNYFNKVGISVTGLDYSAYGCEKFNSSCLPDFIAGDIYENIEHLFNQGRRFDLIWLDNVLEHVLDPLDLLKRVSDLMTDTGTLMVEVPNDFSVIQNHLFEKGYISRKYWVAYPDHLSYFNREGLVNLAGAAGLKNVFSMSDFPIEVNLLNPKTNYCEERSLGKSCYQAKIDLENLLHQQNIEYLTKFYSAMMDVGLGRCIISFFVKG